MRTAVGILLLALQTHGASANCFNINPRSELPLAAVNDPPNHACQPKMSHGYPIPDRSCSPGAINPSVTLAILRTASQPPATGFRTVCVRDKATTAREKEKTYAWYGLPHPVNNHGATQTCELDHIISIELGGADTIDNIWPQCGPSGVSLQQRYFKQKDLVEDYLAAQVRSGLITLKAAQVGIATDWTKYLAVARSKVRFASARGIRGSTM
jgi:5-methylcytosine-specific restriction endonuclease McrA